MQRTQHEANYATAKGKKPKRWSKCGNQIEQPAEKATDEEGPLPSKLVWQNTYENTANKETCEDHRGWYESPGAAFTNKVELWFWKKIRYVNSHLIRYDCSV